MQAMLNHMRRAAEEAGGARAVTRQGTITGYDPDNYAVKVLLHPDETETDWIPLKALAVGNGFGLFIGPGIGDAVEVDFQEGDGEAGSAGWRFFNSDERPLPVPSGEMWLVHETGASVKLTNDGKATVSDKAGSTIIMNGDGTGELNFADGLTINANVSINGSVTATGEGTFNGGHTVSQHTHPSNGAKPEG